MGSKPMVYKFCITTTVFLTLCFGSAFAKISDDNACSGINPIGNILLPKTVGLKYALNMTEQVVQPGGEVRNSTIVENKIEKIIPSFQGRNNVIFIRSIATLRNNGKKSTPHPNEDYLHENDQGLERWDRTLKKWVSVISYDKPLHGKTWTDDHQTTFHWEHLGDFDAGRMGTIKHAYSLRSHNPGTKNRKDAFEATEIYAPGFGLIQKNFQSSTHSILIRLDSFIIPPSH